MKPALRIHPADDVLIARRQLLGGERLEDFGLAVQGLIPPGHKIALRALPKGSPVRRYNQVIGIATQDIAAGQHVHSHNLAFAEFARDAEVGADARPVKPSTQPAAFMGIVRADGRVATRNYIGILTSVNCSATVARAIADHFRRDIHPEALAGFPNVDGVVALTHGMGCATDSEGEPRVRSISARNWLRSARSCCCASIGTLAKLAATDMAIRSRMDCASIGPLATGRLLACPRSSARCDTSRAACSGATTCPCKARTDGNRRSASARGSARPVLTDASEKCRFGRDMSASTIDPAGATTCRPSMSK